MRHPPDVRSRHDSGAANATRKVVPTSRADSIPASEPRYNARLFLEDEQRLLAAAGTPVGEPLHCVELPDGRLLPLPTLPLRDAMRARWHDWFSSRYGVRLGEERERRFRLVLDYVARHSGELMEAGLAHLGEPIAVREEFLDYLLRLPIEGAPPSIPGTALGHFLDEWGHRWM